MLRTPIALQVGASGLLVPVMASIVVLAHQYDRLAKRRFFGDSSRNYLLMMVLDELRRRGHAYRIVHGPDRRAKGDVALLHVDTTVVEPAYLDCAAGFARCLNGGVGDISKRAISQAVVSPGDGWEGAVIVKSNLNCAGFPEQRVNRRARRSGARPPFPAARVTPEYKVYEHSSLAPASAFDDPHLLVERFMPESVDDGFGMRHWIFCGDYDFCGLFVSKERLVKGSGIFRSEPAPVPEDLRALRRKLGFDYGKFDFVMHGGRSYLVDANRTPGGTPKAGYFPTAAGLADGFESIIRTL